MNTQVKERNHIPITTDSDDATSAYIDEVLSRAPHFSDKQIDAVSEALDIKGAA